jgi:hypothetical protein
MLLAADLLQRQLAAFVIQFLEPVEVVATISYHPAGLADIAQLLGRSGRISIMARGDSLKLKPDRLAQTATSTRAWSIDRRQSFDRHHQCPRSSRPVRAPRQGAAGQSL